MRLGVDFGTTHTVAAIVDRGNYPVVSYEWGDAVPSLIAVRDADGALRLGEVIELTGLSLSTVQRLRRAGGFPAPRRLGPSAVRWLESEVAAWLRSRPTAKSRRAHG